MRPCRPACGRRCALESEADDVGAVVRAVAHGDLRLHVLIRLGRELGECGRRWPRVDLGHLQRVVEPRRVVGLRGGCDDVGRSRCRHRDVHSPVPSGMRPRSSRPWSAPATCPHRRARRWCRRAQRVVAAREPEREAPRPFTDDEARTRGEHRVTPKRIRCESRNGSRSSASSVSSQFASDTSALPRLTSSAQSVPVQLISFSDACRLRRGGGRNREQRHEAGDDDQLAQA